MKFIIRLLFLVSTVPIVLNADTKAEIQTIYNRRVEDILQGSSNPTKAEQWKRELTSSGIWNDVDYTSGCDAGRATWPAQQHFRRIITMSALWNQNQDDTDLLAKIRLAMNHWFDRDYKTNDCIFSGGVNGLNCPCGTPGYWNTNWWWQMIHLPYLVGTTCLLLQSALNENHFKHCTNQLNRAYVRIKGDSNGRGFPMTGANMLDVASTGVTLALLLEDKELIEDALGHYYTEAQITTGNEDGIKVDGSFFQHSQQIYNGNYGAVFMRALTKIFIQTAGTSWTPPLSVQEAFLTVIVGSEWMMYLKDKEGDPLSPIVSWQNSVIGRAISNRYEDWHGIGLSFTEILKGTEDWSNHQEFQKIAQRLSSRLTETNSVLGVNPGPLLGTRYFHISDYMVHRGTNYITALRMYSERTTNSECFNGQNPYGFHLSDGTIYTYRTGNEYTNVYGAWDWNLIPGTTIDYEGTTFSCGTVQKRGKEKFVGGAAFGSAGIAVMDFTNPTTGALHWKKAFFFFPGGYVVQFMGDVVSSNGKPIITTLDQRQMEGSVLVDDEVLREEVVTRNAYTVWHDRVGYRFLTSPVDLTINMTPRKSNWAAIGISTGNETQHLVSMSFTHPPGGNTKNLAYIAELDVDSRSFYTRPMSNRIQLTPTLEEAAERGLYVNALVRGAYYGDSTGAGERIIGIAFWSAGVYETGLDDIPRVETDAPILLLFQRKANNMGWTLGASDPSHDLSRVQVVVYFGFGSDPETVNIALPRGAYAGSTTMYEF